jgi:hypothetical protein
MMRATSATAPAAEHIQRQIAVAVVIAVEAAAFLVAVQGIIGGIEVEDDLFGRRLLRLEEEVDEQTWARTADFLAFALAVVAGIGRLNDTSRRQ